MQSGIQDFGLFQLIVAGMCAWVILCAAATAMISNLSRYRGCSELYSTAKIFFVCFFLSPVFAALLVGFTPPINEVDQNLGIEDDDQE